MDKNKPAEKVGAAIGVLLLACVAAVVVALTIKFIIWIIGV